MSTYQRREATPDEFSTLVNEYYRKKDSYNTLIEALLNKPANMPVHPSEENATGSEFSFDTQSPLTGF